MEYQGQIMDLIQNSQSVKYAVLASCATNKFMLSCESRYQSLALLFYSKAVQEVNRALDELSSGESIPSDALLVSVIYLYIHDVSLIRQTSNCANIHKKLCGRDLHANPATHIAGAMALINTRLDRDFASMSITRAIDRVALESVMYQAFSLSMRQPFAPTFFGDERFISRAESLLASRAVPSSSPILNLPLPLYHLIRDIIGICIDPTRRKSCTMTQIALELGGWEIFAMKQDTDMTAPRSNGHQYACFQSLYALAASIIYNWVVGNMPLPLTSQFSRLLKPPGKDPPRTSSSPWQIHRALAILMQRDFFDLWTQSYLATWPMLIFGLATGSQQDASYIRETTMRIRGRTGYGLTQSILAELEHEWQTKWHS